jgi:hypothetical protein
MSSYISSNNNRFYVVLESSYGQTPAPAAQNRIPAVKLTTRQRRESAVRKDKTGTRTFLGDPCGGLRKHTHFALSTYLTGWDHQSTEPAYGPLVHACLGSAPTIWSGGNVASAASRSRLTFAVPHGLLPGQAITVNGELRFVTGVVDGQTVQLNAPLSAMPGANAVAGATATYQTSSELPSVSIFDYWSPATAVQRVLCGAAVNDFKVNVNGDYHEFQFSGFAADLIDSASFVSGDGGVQTYPAEPALDAAYNYCIVPGHLGQVWLGPTPTDFLTVTKAQLTFTNDLTLRDHEFGAGLARGITPGMRNVSLELSLYQQDDANTQALYQAARQRSPIGVMLQLGQAPGHLFGIYMPSVVPEVPEFDDSETRQQWHFVNCRAQGTLNDEIYIAFG